MIDTPSEMLIQTQRLRFANGNLIRGRGIGEHVRL